MPALLAVRLCCCKACASMDVVDATSLIVTAASLSLLAGWRVYLCILATGFAMRWGWIALPDHLDSLQILASPWIIGASAVGATAEFFADKVPWVDSLWDAVHTAIRPVGGALLALAVVNPGDPVWQLASLLLGGSGALLGHAAKSSSRAIINASPEPFSNIAVSTGEDVTSTGLLALTLASPVGAAIVAICVSGGCIALLLIVRRVFKRVFSRSAGQDADSAAR